LLFCIVIKLMYKVTWPARISWYMCRLWYTF